MGIYYSFSLSYCLDIGHNWVILPTVGVRGTWIKFSLLKRYIRVERLRIQTQRGVRQCLGTQTRYESFDELQIESDFFTNFDSLHNIE